MPDLAVVPLILSCALVCVPLEMWRRHLGARLSGVGHAAVLTAFVGALAAPVVARLQVALVVAPGPEASARAQGVAIEALTAGGAGLAAAAIVLAVATVAARPVGAVTARVLRSPR